MSYNLGRTIIKLILILHSLLPLHNSCNNKTWKFRHHLQNKNNRIRNNYNKKRSNMKIRWSSFQIMIFMQQPKWRKIMRRLKTSNQCSQLLSLTNPHLVSFQMKLLRIMKDTIQMVRFAPISSNLRTFWLLRYAEELLKLVIYLIT